MQFNAILAINKLFADESLLEWGINRDRFCKVDKIFKSESAKIYLLKRLHGGSHLDSSNENHRNDLSAELGVSLNTLGTYLDDLRDGMNILGSNVQIDLRHRVNNYDNTIHPVFLALNLSEVHFLTVILKSLTKDGMFKDMATNLIADIYRQLSDYAKEKIDLNASREEIVLFEKGSASDYEEGYRKEKKSDIGFLVKTSAPCILTLKSEMNNPIKGHLVMRGSNIYFRSENGNLLNLDKYYDEIYTLHEDEDRPINQF